MRGMVVAYPKIVQRHLDCFPKRTPRWNEFPPLTREKGVQDIGDSVQCEEPHEEKVVAQTFRKLEFGSIASASVTGHSSSSFLHVSTTLSTSNSSLRKVWATTFSSCGSSH